MSAGGANTDILAVGRCADELRETGLSWPRVVDALGEDNITYVQRAHRAYRAHTDEQARRDQLPLF